MKRSGRGFTLIEVMVALVIVTVCVGAMLAKLTDSANAALFLRDKTFAEWVALNRIAEVRLQQNLPQKGKSDGEAELAGRKWIWHQVVEPMQLKGAFEIKVSVRPEGEGTKMSDEPGKEGWYTTVTGMVGSSVKRGPDAANRLAMEFGFAPVGKGANRGNGDDGDDAGDGSDRKPPPPRDEETEE